MNRGVQFGSILSQELIDGSSSCKNTRLGKFNVERGFEKSKRSVVSMVLQLKVPLLAGIVNGINVDTSAQDPPSRCPQHLAGESYEEDLICSYQSPSGP